MDKLERVARAICSGISGPTICRDVSDCSYCMNAAQAAIDALAEMGAAKVKPLVWKKSLGGEHLRSHCEKDGSAYSIIPEVNRLVVRYGPSLIKVCGEWSDAKAAAQADYEARILAAIEPAPVSVREAARVLLGHTPKITAKPLAEMSEAMKIDAHPAILLRGFCAALRAIEDGKDDD